MNNSSPVSTHHLTSKDKFLLNCLQAGIIWFHPLPFQTDMWDRTEKELHNVMTSSIIWHNRDDSVSARLHKQAAVLTSPSPRLDTLQTQLQTACWRQPTATGAWQNNRRPPPKDQRLTWHDMLVNRVKTYTLETVLNHGRSLLEFPPWKQHLYHSSK